MQPTTLMNLAVGVALGVAGTCLMQSVQPELPVASDADCEGLRQPDVSDRLRFERAMTAVREASAAAACDCEPSDPRPAKPTQSLGLVLENAGDGLSIAQRARMILQQEGALIRALELAPEDQERLLNVLSEQQQRRLLGRDATVDGATVSQREDAELSRAIGRDKAEKFAQLKAAEPARQEWKRVRDQLEQAGEPLTLDQQRALASVMSAVPIKSPLPVPGEPWEQAVSRFRGWVGEKDRTFREQAADILSPSQAQTLKDAAELREAQTPSLRGPTGTAGFGG